MAVGIHAQGFMGIAFETVYNTWVTPTKFFPIKSESLSYQQDSQYRRVIRGLADNIGLVAGFSHVEGDIEMELMEDALPYFLHVMRCSIVKTGAGPYVYTTTPTHSATGTTKVSMSITIVRAGVVFAYTGCYVSQLEIGTDNGIPSMKFSIVGSDEATQAAPTYSALTTSIPFGAGQWNIQVPTATQVFDVASVTATINDNVTPQYRLNNSQKAQFMSFGQREVTAKTSRDFNGRTEYDLFKALTTTSIRFLWSKGAGASVQLTLPNVVRETYDIDGLSDQGSLHMADVQFTGMYDTTTSKSWELVVTCAESIV